MGFAVLILCALLGSNVLLIPVLWVLRSRRRPHNRSPFAAHRHDYHPHVRAAERIVSDAYQSLTRHRPDPDPTARR